MAIAAAGRETSDVADGARCIIVRERPATEVKQTIQRQTYNPSERRFVADFCLTPSALFDPNSVRRISTDRSFVPRGVQ